MTSTKLPKPKIFPLLDKLHSNFVSYQLNVSDETGRQTYQQCADRIEKVKNLLAMSENSHEKQT